MKTWHVRQRRGWRRVPWWIALAWLVALNAWSQSPVISGYVVNRSTWADSSVALTPPGDGDGNGNLIVGVWAAGLSVAGPPVSSVTAASGAMPFTFGGTYAYTLTLATGGAYQVVGFVDADADGSYDLGEPRSDAFLVQVGDTNTVTGVNPTITDSEDDDALPDWWEAHWFRNGGDPLRWSDNDDPDKDGLPNLLEYQIASGGFGMDLMNPAHWDTDGDGMDDYWEWKYYAQALGVGTDPTVSNRVADVDGDGLSSWQEYCGVDGNPRMILDGVVDGVVVGRLAPYDADDLNPLDIDTDFDLLIDSFEAAWYDPANGISPHSSDASGIPAVSGDYNLAIAMNDSDEDGLTPYREMCLHQDLRQGSANEDKWLWPDGNVPFPQLDYFAATPEEERVRVCFMSFTGANLNLGLVMNQAIPASTNRYMLRNHAWTDPTPGTGYNFTDESIPPGWDTDADLLPDGWEVEFNLDPRDPGAGPNYDNGPFGDPDGDGIINWYEYVGPDEWRSQTKPYVNGSGDETNPNEHNHRPDSTYLWRWAPTNRPHAGVIDPRLGLGIRRDETLGSALPTTSLGVDYGTDTDDDGLTDFDEMFVVGSNPSDSSDPFIGRAALIAHTNGIVIPDPEPELGGGLKPAGVREDLQRRDWTIECFVKLLRSGMNGYLLRFQTRLGAQSQVVYSLELTNNAPILRAQFGAYTAGVSAKELPTNRWVHLAGVWDSAGRSLNLYVDGVLQIGQTVTGSGNPGDWLYPATNSLAIGVSRDGSFVNNLVVDEVRIWGIARTREQINKYSQEVAPPLLADDAWIAIQFATRTNLYFNRSVFGDFVLYNGGSLFEGEPGVRLTNALVTFRNHPTQRGVFDSTEDVWVDNGDGIFRIADDIILWNSGSLREGDVGVPLTAYLQNSTPATVVFTDKDGSGGFTHRSLLAYYKFDDGGRTIEDYARRAKNSLFGTGREDYMFGDFGYALPTNNMAWVTNDLALIYGATARHADDSDRDGLPDAWEVRFGLDAFDDGSVLESVGGKKDGPNGALGDRDSDGLVNIYEYWAGTNPRYVDSDGNGVPDTEEDLDGDGVGNLIEQRSGSRPDMVDTDDDGVSDIEELANGTDPANATDPAESRAVELGGAMTDYLEVPRSLTHQLGDWSVEAWIKPASVPSGIGYIVRRVVEQLPGSSNAMNFVIGLESNGAGGLRLFGGYVLANGKTCIISGPPISTGEWTHVAATYSNATLTLYTNGAVALASNSVQFVTPPANGKGGDTYLRIGEGFGGVIDEVRIWDGGRAAGLIYTNYNRTVPRTSAGLVHYFRFDDGQAVTNVFPYGPYHQPGGAQDFVYTNDWLYQWRHAARLRGSAQFVTPGGTVNPPSLKVIITPDSAITAGAQWSLNGGAWQDSGTTLYDLAPGTYSVLFKPLYGWTAPSEVIVALSNGTATVVTRAYQLNGAITITILPTELQVFELWRVDGGVTRLSGAVVDNLAPGNHLVDYVPRGGWIEPASEIVSVPEGTTVTLVRTYSPNIGYLRVFLGPTNAVVDGAQWQVDGGLWNNSGLTVALGVGAHTIGYKKLPGWISPSTDAVTIAYGTTTTLVRAYTPNPNEDSDGDGLPDSWEVLYGLDPYDGTGVNGAAGDPDGDGLNNLYEYWSGTDPQMTDTDGDGIPDNEEDADGDGLSNYEEQVAGTRPDRSDTDDDGWSDGDELDSAILKTDEWRGRHLTSPTYSRSPLVQRSMVLDGTSRVIQDGDRLAKEDWMIDCWVMPTNVGTGHLVLRRTNTGQTNYCLRLENNVPVIEYTSEGGTRYRIAAAAAIPAGAWTRLQGMYSSADQSLSLTVNNVLKQSLSAPVSAARGNGTVEVGSAGVWGYMDNLRISDPPQSFDVVLVLDVSGSMAGSRLASLKTAAERALDALAADVPVGLITFSDGAEQLTDGFTLDRTLLKELIRGLEAGGGTDYEAALSSALDMVQRFSGAQKHIEVFISDGVPNTPPSDALILEQAAANIRIYSIGFQLDDATELQRLASLTGGRFFNAPTATELQSALREIFETGVFSVLYLFDDDAVTAEDFMHQLDWTYALTNVAFSSAAYYETSLDDKDNDGLPDWWEALYGLNPNNADGDNGPYGDPDGDGLNNLYEYFSDTNPRKADSDGDGVPDAMEDYDQDGLQNGDEQTYGSDPRVADTDDDGLDDREEVLTGTSPSSSLSPWKLQALSFAGGASDYIELPAESRLGLSEWTVEAWVRPASGWGGGGSIVRRSCGTGLTNYVLEVDSSLRPVAGFGSNRVVAGSAIPADGATWTHLAATYQKEGHVLRLYVNGVEVGSRVCGENPPITGAGPLVQRVGENFNGLVAEVRLWSVPRSAAQISDAMGRALAGTESGLAAYYRGNDGTRRNAPNIGTSGNNLTGGAVDPGIAPWTWGQVEDFAGAFVTNDWMRRWRSCATIYGNVTYSNTLGVVASLPALRVVLQPAGAVAAGGQWSVNGGPWHDSGDLVTISDTNALTLQLGYRSIYGWTPPPVEIVTISNGVTTTLTRYYRRNGTLTVHLEPAAITNDAAFRVDGGAWKLSGTTVSNLSPGSHLLEYKAVEGWAEPPSEGITIAEEEAAELTRFYEWAMGRLVVYISPAGAVLGGGQWTIDGSNYYDTGYALSLTAGVYTIQFKSIAAWDAPSNIAIAVGANAETNATGVYTAAPNKDSDADGLPDWWEVQYGLDPFDATGINGASGDPDSDGLINIHEYWCGTDPLNPDTDSDGIGDGEEDADGDGLTNRQEQDLGTRSDRTDTDDDGWSDGDEIDRAVLKSDMWHGRRLTGPAYSRSPWIARSMALTGTALAMSPATAAYLDQAEWMIDVWYLGTNATPVSGRLVERRAANGLTNFCLRLVNGVPVVEFQTPQGVRQQLSAGVGIPTNEWVHLTASWKPDTYGLELVVNERSFAATLLASVCARGTGTVTVGDAGLGGYLDNLMIRNPSPQDVIMVLDVSGSMEGTKIQTLRETAKLAVDLLPEDTPIAVITFSTTATNLSGGFSTDRTRLKLLIDSLTANGMTSYKSAVNELTNVVATYSTYERHLCLFLSDGAPTESPSLEEILAARDRNIRIDTIGLELYDASALQQLSQLTGGTFYDVPTPERLQAAFEGILRQIFKVSYLFDDGGTTAEDMDHPLNWAYALSNVTFSSTVYVDPVWSGDAETGLPEWWRDFFYGGDVEAWSDTDSDGLSALYEYWCDTHPLLKDTDGDGVLDSHEDYDLDGLDNADEQTHGTDPRLADTDDDGIVDLNEKLNGTAGNNSLSPLQLRTLRLSGASTDYAELPRDRKFALSSWTLEAWVCPSAGWAGDGSVVRRVVANGVTNFFLSVDSSRRPMAGFGGYLVTGAVAIAADGTTWTHLAATYDALSQELVLYVNTTQAAQRICGANPEVNGVGPLIQRIGERWNGQIDEVRIWKSVRSREQLASGFMNPLTGDETDLVAYYRFDDGTSESAGSNVGTSANNLENGVPVGGIARWTWGQVEDFALNYGEKDWTNRWRHAATLRGNTMLTNAPGAVQPQPSVRVLLYPASAVAAGAKWSLDGSAWLDSGASVSLLGTQLVVQLTYRDGVYGWTPPTNETITLTNGQALTLTRYYRQNGTLTVSLQPMAAASNGAQWSVSGGLAWNDSDVTVSNLSPGTHAVIFQTIPGWIAPAATNVDIPEGGAAFIIATYEPLVAPLYGIIEPPEAITNGAQWRVDGGAWTNSGTYVTVSYGAHTVDFYPLTGWVTPDPIAVYVTDASTQTVTGRYRRITGLQVFIEPETARLAGASWRVSGGAYYASGVLLELEPATYSVDFLPLAGWIEPLTQQVVVVSNSITTLNVRYYQYDLIPTNFVGLFTRPRGIDFDSQRRLYIADSMNNRVVVYDTRTGTATNFGGPIATNTAGMFNQPLSVALDAADNLYVADANNHRIQRRNVQTGVWTVWGGPTSGTGVGQFNTPFDVTVDSFTNIYVADHYNHRVQKRIATNGAWIVLISNGFANGFVRFPSGVEVDASNRLYVSDFPSTNDGPRIQVFTTNGVFVEQIGGRASGLGGMERPYRMDFGLSNDLFVAEWGLDAAMRRVGSNAWEFIVGAGRLNNPEGVAWEDRGYLYIADTDNQRIIRVLVTDLSTNIPPAFSGMALGPNGMEISWPGALGWFYTLQYTDTGFPPWFDVPGCAVIRGTNGVISCTDTNNFGIPTRIYRVLYY